MTQDYRLFLDDERMPPSAEEDSWVIVRTSKAAIEVFLERGAPYFISFDHDLGGDDTTITFVNWMIEHALDEIASGIAKSKVDFPKNYYVHSQNSEGAANIRGKMSGFLRYLAD